MTGNDLIRLYTELEKLGITIWIDGGWGVDALLGVQTRPHSDLDIAIEQRNAPALYEFLAARGFREIKREREWNFVLSDQHGREIDVHTFILDVHGNVEKGFRTRRDRSGAHERLKVAPCGALRRIEW
jgi:lincosamide nucleotidyltransferase A/C/D/E